ncbi:hypothetical protein L0Y69_00075 [bacterium]|nr:hypothetical protein [bacterium]
MEKIVKTATIMVISMLASACAGITTFPPPARNDAVLSVGEGESPPSLGFYITAGFAWQ